MTYNYCLYGSADHLNSPGRPRTLSVVIYGRTLGCGCLHNSVLLESLVIVLTIVSVLAITGDSLITFDLITVPQYVSVTSSHLVPINSTDDDSSSTTTSNNSNIISSNNNSSSTTTSSVSAYMNVVEEHEEMQDNEDVLDLLHKIFEYTSLAIAGLFVLEIIIKVCTLRKLFLTKPWQIFDTVVVMATLALELVFYFLELKEPALHFVTYVVVLRLWRIPFVCNMRAIKVQQSLDQDIELYRCGKVKAEEKCYKLEDTLSQQAETIRALENMIHNLAASGGHDITDGMPHITANGDVKYLVNGGDRKRTVAPLPGGDVPISRNNNITPQSKNRRPKQNTGANHMETTFTEIPEDQGVLHSKLVANQLSKSKSKDMSTNKKENYDKDTNRPAGDMSADDWRPEVSKNVEALCALDTMTYKLPRSEASYNLHSESLRPNKLPARTRKRRSSTSEVIDYRILNSPDRDPNLQYEALEKRNSCPDIDPDNVDAMNKLANLENKDRRDIETQSADGAEKTGSSASDTQKVKTRNRARRFPSCPEYVFTQRMSLTNDESKLIGDEHTVNDPAVFDNLAFENDEQFRMHVMADFDGSKTYRNEDGIPMTSL